MKMTDYTAFAAGTALRTRPEAWARRTLHALFTRLQVGSLSIEEGGDILHFGESRAEARIKACIQVKHMSAYLAILRGGSTGAGEAYMHGLWDSPDLVHVVRLFVLNMETLRQLDGGASWIKRSALRLFHALHRNSIRGSRANISAHYDLSNDFFALFLDRTMAYSAGIFDSPATALESASLAKFERVCSQLQLAPSDHLLEIGTGWGGLAIYAARRHGCRVTTTTVSREQYRHARDWVEREGLSERVTVLQQDYRELTGQYDKLVSIEMIEAVGAEYYADFFNRCSRLLRPQGLMLMQAITIPDQRYEQSLRNVDFIKRYIFPGGQLPSNAAIAASVAKHTDMQLAGMFDITLDYAFTLRAWHARFQERLLEVRQLGLDETFIRMWRFYLCFCEGGFLERAILTAQYLLAKPGYRPE